MSPSDFSSRYGDSGRYADFHNSRYDPLADSEEQDSYRKNHDDQIQKEVQQQQEHRSVQPMSRMHFGFDKPEAASSSSEQEQEHSNLRGGEMFENANAENYDTISRDGLFSRFSSLFSLPESLSRSVWANVGDAKATGNSAVKAVKAKVAGEKGKGNANKNKVDQVNDELDTKSENLLTEEELNEEADPNDAVIPPALARHDEHNFVASSSILTKDEFHRLVNPQCMAEVDSCFNVRLPLRALNIYVLVSLFVLFTVLLQNLLDSNITEIGEELIVLKAHLKSRLKKLTGLEHEIGRMHTSLVEWNTWWFTVREEEKRKVKRLVNFLEKKLHDEKLKSQDAEATTRDIAAAAAAGRQQMALAVAQAAKEGRAQMITKRSHEAPF